MRGSPWTLVGAVVGALTVAVLADLYPPARAPHVYPWLLAGAAAGGAIMATAIDSIWSVVEPGVQPPATDPPPVSRSGVDAPSRWHVPSIGSVELRPRQGGGLRFRFYPAGDPDVLVSDDAEAVHEIGEAFQWAAARMEWPECEGGVREE